MYISSIGVDVLHNMGYLLYLDNYLEYMTYFDSVGYFARLLFTVLVIIFIIIDSGHLFVDFDYIIL
jgi:hypothetical protein